MKKDTTPNDNSPPKPLCPFPFQTLLPEDTIDGLTPEHMTVLLERLDDAVAAKTEGITLTEREERSFRENCQMIHKAGIGLELRNYAFLEIHKAKQWRSEYQTARDFAVRYAKLSPGQMNKCIDSAEIALLMAKAGLGAVAPRGRQVEALAKIADPDHRVPAWKAALPEIERCGKSAIVLERALRRYCEEHETKYRRRASNGAKNNCQNDSDSSTTESPPTTCPAEKCGWTDLQSGPDSLLLITILDMDLVEAAIVEFDGEHPGTKIVKILKELGTGAISDKIAAQMETVLSLVKKTDPLIEGQLRKMALILLAKTIGLTLEQKIGECRGAKERLLANMRTNKESDSPRLAPGGDGSGAKSPEGI